MEEYRALSACRACDGKSLETYLDLGKMPLVNSLLRTPDEPTRRYPLEVVFCGDCGLSQLSGVVDPSILFSEYAYQSSISQTFLNHCAGLAKVCAELGMREQDLVVDIASNDGAALKQFLPYGIRPLGVDPATNLAIQATADGIPTVNEFWGPSLADRVLSEHGSAKIITAQNVFAHVNDINAFAAGVKKLLDKEGTFVIEVPYGVDMFKDNLFDTIYHEHLSYFMLGPMMRVLERNGLYVNRVDRIDIHGGTIRVYAQHDPKPDTSVESLLLMEESEGWRSFERYREFGSRPEAIKEDLAAFIGGLRYKGKRIAGFGASAKGCIMLNYCGMTSEHISFIVDDTPTKQGKWQPGTRIPVLPRAALETNRPDYLLVLAWNFLKEVKAKTSGFKQSGGRYILPVPALHIET